MDGLLIEIFLRTYAICPHPSSSYQRGNSDMYWCMKFAESEPSLLHLQGIYPLPYWTGIIVFHAIYAGFELKRFQNFNKYGEVGTYLLPACV